jgi:cation diffusion facilitator CzcD-associated flavoprotein CzcO
LAVVATMATDSDVFDEAPAKERSRDSAPSEYDAIVVGAGFAGVRMLWELRRQGLSVRVLEKAAGPGGTWYWNRYPGAHSDTPSCVYCFLFDSDLLQEWDWSEVFPGQADIEAYFNYVLDRLDMRKDMQFNTTVISASFIEETGRWTITTEDGEEFQCKYFISATGVLHAALEPPFPGTESFEGEAYLTARWPKEPVDFVGKRVAVVGTGASAAQVIPIVADDAKDLKIFQRTPTYVLPARNQPLDDYQRNSLKRNYDRLKELVSKHPYALAYELPERTFLDTPPDRREGVLERGWELGGFHLIFSTFDDLLTNQEANDMCAEFVRRKIRAIVQDPETAELLCPKDHPIFSKRPPVGLNYYESYNRSNVSLIDIRSNPIARITPHGILLDDGTEHEFDMIIYALGFDAATGSLTRMECRGRGGELLRDKWKRAPDTYLGLLVEGFPNLFILSGPGAQFSNFPPAIEAQSEWIGKAIAHMRSRGYDWMEPTNESAGRWTATLDQIAAATLVPQGAEVGAWFYGQNVPGKPKATYFFLGGVPMYVQLMTAEAKAGFPGFSFVAAGERISVG